MLNLVSKTIFDVLIAIAANGHFVVKDSSYKDFVFNRG